MVALPPPSGPVARYKRALSASIHLLKAAEALDSLGKSSLGGRVRLCLADAHAIENNARRAIKPKEA